MPPRRILILGGTAEARALAEILVEHGCDVTTSLAGATAEPAMPAGCVQTGGFGGLLGLTKFLREVRFDAIADATHPFAATISRNAKAAADATDIPYFRLDRPPWEPQPRDCWTPVQDAESAARLLPAGARVLLTVGRREVEPFLMRSDLSGVARMIEAPIAAIPPNWRLLRARPPFALGDELSLMEARGISHLVTKNAGGETMRAKIDAARERKIPVIMIARPQKPDAVTASDIASLFYLLMA